MLTKDFVLIYYLKLALLCFTAHIIRVYKKRTKFTQMVYFTKT
jgi:hypothetical protein